MDDNSFLTWWQTMPRRMEPTIFSVGSFSLQYYGLMYLVAFTVVYFLAVSRLKKESRFAINTEILQGLITASVLGVLVGGRLGYVLFYNFSYYMQNPLEIILPFTFSDGLRFTGIAGMSFHGGVIGVIIGGMICCRRNKISFFAMGDLLAPCTPLGYTFGRLGNFINGELWGRPTTLSIGMYFPLAEGDVLRHPSQLYEGFFEGIVLFAVLWSLRKKFRTEGASLAHYLMGYGFVRFFIEYVREPDSHLGFVLGTFSMGQILCLVMILGGAGLLAYLRFFRKVTVEQSAAAAAAAAAERTSAAQSSSKKSGRKFSKR